MSGRNARPELHRWGAVRSRRATHGADAVHVWQLWEVRPVIGVTVTGQVMLAAAAQNRWPELPSAPYIYARRCCMCGARPPAQHSILQRQPMRLCVVQAGWKAVLRSRLTCCPHARPHAHVPQSMQGGLEMPSGRSSAQ